VFYDLYKSETITVNIAEISSGDLKKPKKKSSKKKTAHEDDDFDEDDFGDV
jgi:hypothetical protein